MAGSWYPFMSQLSTQVDSDQMGKGLGGLLIEAAEDYSQRCLTAGSHPEAIRIRESNVSRNVNLVNLAPSRHAIVMPTAMVEL